MLTYTFVIPQDMVIEAKANTTRPFKNTNLYITKVPSIDSEVGYEIIDDTVVIKYEKVDDDIIINYNDPTNNHQFDIVPTVLGVVLKQHGLRKLRAGTFQILADVTVNEPDGLYAKVRTAEGLVEHHPLNGDVFIYSEGFGYIAVLEFIVADLYSKYVQQQRGQFIPDEYVIRFKLQSADLPVYVPMKWLFHDVAVAESFFPNIPAEAWEELAEVFSVHYAGGKQ